MEEMIIIKKLKQMRFGHFKTTSVFHVELPTLCKVD